MNWLKNLWRKPAEKSVVAVERHKPAPQPIRPAVDIEALRRDLSSAGADRRESAAKALGEALASLKRSPDSGDAAEVWVAAVAHQNDKELALAWLDRVSGDDRLGDLAAQARHAELRLAAARRIDDAAVLERVAQACRDKDKRVHRHCVDSLKQRRQAEAQAAQLADLAGRLRAMLDETPLSQARLIALDKEVRGFAGEADAGECLALLEQARARAQQESEARRAVPTGQAEAAALQAECADPAWPGAGRINAWQARRAVLDGLLAGLPTWLAEQTAGQAMAESLRTVEARLAALAEDADRMHRCTLFLDGLSVETPAAETPIETAPPDRAEIEAAWSALAKPEHRDAMAILAARWQTLCPACAPVAVPEPTPEPMPEPETEVVAEAKPARAPKVDYAALHAALAEPVEQLEQAVAQGHLAEADAAAKKIEALLGGNHVNGALAGRIQHAYDGLRELRGWARWGSGQAREHLIAAAETLLAGETDPEALATAVPALRKEWQQLTGHGPASEAQWQRFDAILEQAWQPVAARRAEEAAAHAEARAAREALLAEWEAWFAGLVWEHVDYKAVETRRQEIVKQWREMPHASFRDERNLRKRMDAVLADIDARLDLVRGMERARREQIVAAAEALVGEADLGRAMSAAKALQGQWQQAAAPLRLNRDEEQKYWRRFRAACDAVFARRDSQRAEQVAELEARAQARQALLDSHAAALESAQGNDIKTALERFRAEWDGARTGPRGNGDDLDGRARELQRRAQQRIDALRQEKHRARFTLLTRKAALAEAVEQAAATGKPIEPIVAQTRQTWDELARLPGKAEGLLAERFAAAPTVDAARLAAGLAAREAMLLDLEIALDVPSPEAYVASRRERQIERLRNRFGAAADEVAPNAEDLLVQWYATPAHPDPGHAVRVSVALAKLVEQAENGAGL